MSIELNWETLTGGPDGADLADRIRDFIHVKFQAVPLPRFIKSVTVHEFAFGTIPPSVVLKDICDPLPDFYEEDYEPDDEDDVDGDEGDDEGVPDAIRTAERRRRAEQRARDAAAAGDDFTGRAVVGASGTATPFGEGFFPPHVHSAGLRNAPGAPDLASPFYGLGVSAPGMPGGPSKMHYFQSKLGPGWSGAQTPLAAVAGAQHLSGWLDATTHSQAPPSSHHYISRSNSGHSRHLSQGSISVENYPNSLTVPAQSLRSKHSVSTLSPTPSAVASRPPTRERPGASPLATGSVFDGGAEYTSATSQAYARSKATVAVEDEDDEDDEDANGADSRGRQEPRPDDMQAVFRIRYAGDVRLELTAMILLDYPMPSFVGIPLKLNITGLTFDGVGVIAYIRKRVHFCFLSPEDAIAAVGEDDETENETGNEEDTIPAPTRPGHEARGSEDRTVYNSPGPKGKGKGRMGGLLQEIRVESEIGQREGSKQSLKNVGKVEKFVLEQVRRIFEEEFVYPSFWTFLV
ncbi:hypothetical protein F5Y03DRAFT_370817 [Xylaria venustula]|nr:hypothetical protein F5Y03DRAFT_370817 [Xylaria venustula]